MQRISRVESRAENAGGGVSGFSGPKKYEPGIARRVQHRSHRTCMAGIAMPLQRAFDYSAYQLAFAFDKIEKWRVT